jgi:cell division septation protein DedD
MSPRTEDYHEEEHEELEEPSRRGIFGERSYRLLLAVVVLAVVVVIALPYVLDWWSPAAPPPKPLMKAQIPPPPSLPPTQPAPKVEAPKPQTVLPPAKPGPAAVQAPAPGAAAPPKVAAKAASKPEQRAAKPAKEPSAAIASTKGEYWIQVGAFQDQAKATQLAAQLTAQKYPVRQVERASPDRPVVGTHEVFVIGATRSEVAAKLPGTDYRAEAAGAEVVIRPALALKDAVALSRELARQGLTVKIRRSGATATFHAVRVGGYPDRQRAQAVQKDLQDKGFSGFIVKGEG